MDETIQFLEDNKDLFELPIPEASDVTTEETTEEDADSEQKLRNRRERRLSAKLQAERESSIALAARLEAITEAKRSTEGADYLKSIERIYGTDTPEAATATDLLKNALQGLKEDAKNEALETIREESRKAQEAEREAAKQLDGMIEEIEEEFGVALSAEHQKGYFRLLEKLSPKDSDGNILHYADPIATFEEYQERLNRTKDTKAKDLASRGSIQSGQGAAANLTNDVSERWLTEQGII